MMAAGNERDLLLALPDEQLLRLCRVERCRGTGPGGQKRNKTESAVTVTHPESGISGSSDETRSQHSNLRLAVRHLRHALALNWRAPPPAIWKFPAIPGARDPQYPQWLAAVLDVLEAHGGRLSEAAAVCGLSTGRLGRGLAGDPALWQHVNRRRRELGLPPLRQST